MRQRRASFRAVSDLIGRLSEPELLALIDNPDRLKEFVGQLVGEIKDLTFVEPMDDKDVHEMYRDYVVAWRRMAAALGYTGPVAWKVRKGFTLKHHAKKMGPCSHSFIHIPMNNVYNVPTKDCLVFWVPVVLTDSFNQVPAEMIANTLAKVRSVYEISAVSHLNSFGQASLLAALMFAHFKRTGERVPNDVWVRTDTLCATAEITVALKFSDEGLDYQAVAWAARSDLGCFPIGVENRKE